MDSSEELSELVNGLSLHPLETENGLPTHIDFLLRKISGLFGSIYEIEELRHASPDHETATSIDELVARLDAALVSIQGRVESILSSESISNGAGKEYEEDITELKAQWEKVSRARGLLKEELKEDGWLIRFRTTAEQAEAMMDPLQKSLVDCTAVLDTRHNDPSAIEKTYASHESMKATYVPSVIKILKMLKKGVQERYTQNGEALRRLGEMQTRWANLSRQLQQLDGRFRIARNQIPDDGSMEVLKETTPMTRQDGYYGGTSSGSGSNSRLDSGSAHKPALSRTGSRSPVTEMHRKIRRQSSTVSQGAPGEKPRWDVGTRPPPVPNVPAMYQTPSSRRLSTFGPRPPAPRSPTPSSSSVTSGSRISVPGSRIPVRSPTTFTGTRSELVVPSLSSTNSNDNILAGASRRQTLGPDSYLTPTRPRASAPFSIPRSTTPSLAPRAASYGATLGPGARSEPRRTLGRNPPSSFRSTTPTPSRPSSRMSTSSFLVSTAALHPFEPSKYDLLDQEVQKVIQSTEFKLFVARLDVPLKRGQMKRDDEEWKGEFAFGAGERSSSVKLLKLVGRAMDGGNVRMKVMCRVAGAWQELSAVLRDRMARAPAQSP